MSVWNFFELLESPAGLIDVDLYFGDDCEDAISLTGDKVLDEYGDWKLLSFDIGCCGLSMSIERS